jgi:hypothetical protein
MQHDLAVVPVHKHEDGYGCLITTNPLNGQTVIDRHSPPAIPTRMSSPTGSSNSCWKPLHNDCCRFLPVCRPLGVGDYR